MKDFLVAFLTDKPHIGILFSMGGLGTSILSWLHVISIIFGALGALIGFAAGLITFMIKYREWKRGK